MESIRAAFPRSISSPRSTRFQANDSVGKMERLKKRAAGKNCFRLETMEHEA